MRFLLLITLLVSQLAYGAKPLGDDDLLLETPSLGKNNWFYIGQDYRGLRYSYETTTVSAKDGTIVAWVRQDEFTNAEHLISKETLIIQWQIDCRGEKASSLQKWAIDGSNYPWKTYPVDKNAVQQFGRASHLSALCVAILNK